MRSLHYLDLTPFPGSHAVFHWPVPTHRCKGRTITSAAHVKCYIFWNVSCALISQSLMEKENTEQTSNMGLTFWCCSSCWWWQISQFDPRCDPVQSRLPPDGPASSDTMTSGGTFYSGYWNGITGGMKLVSPFRGCSMFYRHFHITVSLIQKLLLPFLPASPDALSHRQIPTITDLLISLR